MTYSSSSKILAADYNLFVTGSEDGVGDNEIANLNTVYGVGYSSYGYGQPSLNSVNVNGRVLASHWSTLFNKIIDIGLHQNTSLGAMTNSTYPMPTANTKIRSHPYVGLNITSLYTNHLNAKDQGQIYTYVASHPAPWKSWTKLSHVVSFSSGDSARYFFNSGGQFKLTFSHPLGSAKDATINAIATNSGELVISSVGGAGTATIKGITYRGLSRIGGSGLPTTLITSGGYYSLTTLPTTFFRYDGINIPPSQGTSHMYVQLRTNGAVGSNGDNGNTITIDTYFNTQYSDQYLQANTATSLKIVNPSTTKLVSTWGVPTVVTSSSAL